MKFIRPTAGVRNALLAALLFGASAPLSKILLYVLSPMQLAGALYLGSGVGLALWRLTRRLRRNAPKIEASLGRADWPWLIGAILSGGVVAPVLLMVGLTTTPASSTSLLLNLEGVLTALLAWFGFRENFDRRIFLGMIAIVAGGLLLSWNPGGVVGFSWGSVGNCRRLFLLGDRQQSHPQSLGSRSEADCDAKRACRWNSESWDRSSDERKSANPQLISGRRIARLSELRG